MTRLEAYRAALSAAVRDGDTAVVKSLTRAVSQEIRQKTSPLGTFCVSASEKRQVEKQ
jgi:hypothetical protein